jgi:hypothetical protein
MVVAPAVPGRDLGYGGVDSSAANPAMEPELRRVPDSRYKTPTQHRSPRMSSILC